jgi:hypothetical protein
MNQLADYWQKKRSRMKQFVAVSGLAVLAIVVSVLLNVYRGEEIRWVASGVLAAAALGAFFFSLTAYTNTMLVAMYYQACRKLLHAPEDLELVTGTIEEVRRLQMPYIGMLYQVTIRVAGETIRYYCPGKLLSGLHPRERIRVFAHDLFAVRVETTGQIEMQEGFQSA